MSVLRTSQELIEILKKHLGLTTDAALANALQITSGKLAQWRHKNRVNYEDVLSLAIEEGLDLNILLNPRRDYYREKGMTPENERYTSASGTGEVFRLGTNKDSNFIVPYDLTDSIWLNTPNYIATVLDRYWTVPDDRMYPHYKKDDILIVRKLDDIPQDGVVGLIAFDLYSQDSTTTSSFYLGALYNSTKTIDAGGVNEYDYGYRVSYINPDYPDTIIKAGHMNVTFFEIILKISTLDILEKKQRWNDFINSIKNKKQ